MDNQGDLTTERGEEEQGGDDEDSDQDGEWDDEADFEQDGDWDAEDMEEESVGEAGQGPVEGEDQGLSPSRVREHDYGTDLETYSMCGGRAFFRSLAEDEYGREILQQYPLPFPEDLLRHDIDVRNAFATLIMHIATSGEHIELGQRMGRCLWQLFAEASTFVENHLPDGMPDGLLDSLHIFTGSLSERTSEPSSEVCLQLASDFCHWLSVSVLDVQDKLLENGVILNEGFSGDLIRQVRWAPGELLIMMGHSLKLGVVLFVDYIAIKEQIESQPQYSHFLLLVYRAERSHFSSLVVDGRRVLEKQRLLDLLRANMFGDFSQTFLPRRPKLPGDAEERSGEQRISPEEDSDQMDGIQEDLPDGHPEEPPVFTKAQECMIANLRKVGRC